MHLPIGSMYAIYGNIYHQYTPNVSIYTIHGSYGLWVYLITSYGKSWVLAVLGHIFWRYRKDYAHHSTGFYCSFTTVMAIY